MLPILQSGFAVTLSLRGPREGGGSAPLRMARELVSGLPVSTQSGRRRLMYHMRMRGQMGGRDGREIKKKRRQEQVKITQVPGGVELWAQPLQGLLFPLLPRFFFAYDRWHNPVRQC